MYSNIWVSFCETVPLRHSGRTKSLYIQKKPFLQESEDEERQLSLEGSLLDLRSYVEAILAQTNLQLGGIAHEVDTAQEKIMKVSGNIRILCNRDIYYALSRSRSIC